MQIDGVTLTDGLAAYGAPDDPLLPMGELGRLLEYDLEVLPAERRIVGRLGEARTSLIVDLATGTARVGAKSLTVSAADVAVTPTEIYLRASAVERLLPLKLKVQAEDLAITIKPEALIPVQSRLQRVAREQMQGLRGSKAADEILKLPAPYHLVSLPAFDLALQLGVRTDQKPHVPFRYDIRAGADVLFTDFQAYVGSNESGVPTVSRFLFERRSPDGTLLGPLHARVVSAGDVYTPGWTLGPRSIAGRGVSLSTIPLDQTNIFNRIDLRGELPLGYDVELYINDILQSGQNTPTKGRYEFLNVALSRGVNVIRIVTYGPHGERSEDTRIVNVGGGQLERGEWQFEFGAEQQEVSVLNLKDPQATAFVSPAHGGVRAVGNAYYGLTSLITLTGGLAMVPETTTRSRIEYAAGLRTSVYGFLTQLDVAGDDHGGSAASLGIAGQVFGASATLRQVELQGGFQDENGPGADFTRPLRSRTEFSLDGNAGLRGLVIPLSFRTVRTAYGDGSATLTSSVRGSATTGPILFSTGLEYATTYGGTGSTPQTLSGFFAGSTFRNFSWQLRGTLDYDILPTFKPRSLAITADHDVSSKLSFRFGVGETLDKLQDFNLTASAVMRTNAGDLSLLADYNNATHGVQLGAQLNVGAAYNPQKKRYEITRPGPGTGGSVLFHAFIDKNGNGHWDPGEPGVPGIIVEGGTTRGTTDASGQAFLTGIVASATARLAVDTDAADLGSMKAPPAIVQIRPRAGNTINVEYPMQPTSELLVRILLARPDGTKVGVSAVQVRLVSTDGRTAEARSEFDGSASFENLTAGTYKLELDPDQAARLRMTLLTPITVTIKGDGGFTPDATAMIAFAPRPAEETDKQPPETGDKR
ncbi:hypothetical protein [Phenylobacterium sp.]|uniref:hypothetical protein n=1 Tax=Phenylobacterium sp. TaxID=1871053 RepID=UPI002DF34392|nr:hypothetical protein [Phenylobacterium sp.]